MRKAYTGFGTLAVVSALSLGLSASAADYSTLDEPGDPLRTTFNADTGKVRVLMLVAPT